jgi:hypothetical protein
MHEDNPRKQSASISVHTPFRHVNVFLGRRGISKKALYVNQIIVIDLN